jgi:hypothetical protein
MAQDILPILREEEGQLLAQLSQMPQFQKLEAVRRMIALYSGTSVREAALSSRQNNSVLSKLPPLKLRGKGARILDAAEAYLGSLGRRAQVKEITDELIRLGLPPGDKNPVSATSAYLSAAKDRFDNKLGEGYGLVKWANQKPDQNQAERSSSEEEAGGLAPPVASVA